MCHKEIVWTSFASKGTKAAVGTEKGRGEAGGGVLPVTKEVIQLWVRCTIDKLNKET